MLILLLRSGEGSVERHKLSICFRLLVQAHDGDDISQVPGLCFRLLSISEASRCSELVPKLSIQLFPMQRLIKFVRIRNEIWAPDTQRTIIAAWTEPSPTTVAKVRGVDRPPSLKDGTHLFLHLLQGVLVWHRDLQSCFASFYR